MGPIGGRLYMPQLTCSEHDSLIGVSPHQPHLLLMSHSAVVLVLLAREFSPLEEKDGYSTANVPS